MKKIHRYILNRKLMTTAICALLTGIGANTHVSAQETAQPASETEELVVVGIRSSIKQSAEIKKNANAVIDAITAEDVGKFPDQNVLEAMQRVTGVQITRDETGSGSAFQIRGITQNRISINGRTALGAEGENRNFNLGDLPAEIISGLEVVKSPTADMVEGSLGATINVKTARPFNFRKNKRVFNIKAKYGDNIEKWFGNYQTLLTQRWDTPFGEMGALLNVAYNENKVAGDTLRLNQWQTRCPSYALTDLTGNTIRGNGLPQGGGVNNCNAIETAIPGATTQRLYMPGQFTNLQYEEERDQTGINTAFQWRPTDYSEYFFELAHVEKENRQARDTLRINLVDGRDNLDPAFFNGRPDGYVYNAAQNVVLAPRQVDIRTNDLELVDTVTPIEYAELGSAYMNNTSAQGSILETETTSFAVSGRWDFESFAIDAEINYGEAEHLRRFVTANMGRYRDNQLGFVDAGEGITSVFQPAIADFRDGRLAGVGWLGHSLTDPRYYRLLMAQDDGWRHESSELAAKIDVDYDLDIWHITTLEFGVRLTDGDFARNSRFRFRCNRNTNDFQITDRACTDPSASAVDRINEFPESLQVTTGFFDQEDIVIPGDWLQVNSRLHFTDPGLFREVIGFNDSGTDRDAGHQEFPNETYDIFEDTAAAYVKLNLEGDIMGQWAYRANVGVRAAYTDLRTLTYIDEAGNVNLSASRDNDYSNLLPSANLALVFSDDTIVRLAAARVMVRPNYSDLKPAPNLNNFAGCRLFNPADPLDATGAAYPSDYPVSESDQQTAVDSYNSATDACPGVRQKSSNSVGNPNLAPYTADNYEISLEHYWGDANSASIAFFQRDVDGEIQNRTVIVEQPITTQAELTGAVVPGVELWLANTKINAPPSTRQGIEASYSQFFDFLPSPYDGFGISANYTYAEGERSPAQYINMAEEIVSKDDPGAILVDPNAFQPLNNLSENAYNISVFYEKYGLSARLAYTYRNKFFKSGDTNWRFQSPTDRLDLSTSYKINNRIKVFFNAENLLRHNRHQYDRDPLLTREVLYTDVRFTLGAKFEL